MSDYYTDDFDDDTYHPATVEVKTTDYEGVNTQSSSRSAEDDEVYYTSSESSSGSDSDYDDYDSSDSDSSSSDDGWYSDEESSGEEDENATAEERKVAMYREYARNWNTLVRTRGVGLPCLQCEKVGAVLCQRGTFRVFCNAECELKHRMSYDLNGKSSSSTGSKKQSKKQKAVKAYKGTDVSIKNSKGAGISKQKGSKNITIHTKKNPGGYTIRNPFKKNKPTPTTTTTTTTPSKASLAPSTTSKGSGGGTVGSSRSSKSSTSADRAKRQQQRAETARLNKETNRLKNEKAAADLARAQRRSVAKPKAVTTTPSVTPAPKVRPEPNPKPQRATVVAPKTETTTPTTTATKIGHYSGLNM